MSSKITISFEVESVHMEYFAEAVGVAIENCSEPLLLYRGKKGTIEEFHYERAWAQTTGLASLYKALMESTHNA